VASSHREQIAELFMGHRDLWIPAAARLRKEIVTKENAA
jgi:hypothetical protein